MKPHRVILSQHSMRIKRLLYKYALSCILFLNCTFVLMCPQGCLLDSSVLEHSLSGARCPPSAPLSPAHPWPRPQRSFPTESTRLFPVIRWLLSYHQILWQHSSRSDPLQWSRFQHLLLPPRTTALRTPLLSNRSNTPPCSPRGRLSRYFSRYHKATSSPPGCKVCVLQSPSTHLCLKPLMCLDLRLELPS